MSKDFELSSEQQQAKDLAKNWLAAYLFGNHDQQIFRIFGFAGTGKTTIIRELLTNFPELQANFAAYTGKAAMVMRKQGLPATTIHKMLYQPIRPDNRKCEQLFEKAKAEKNKKKATALWNELNEARKVQFTLRDDALNHVDLIVLDECSMVNDEILQDLLSFKLPVLVLGDPGQLSPISGDGVLMKERPDILLTEIHRQAAENPIIDFATRARNGIPIPTQTNDSRARHFPKGHPSANSFLHTGFDQIIVGKNKTRRELNKILRRGLNRIEPYPVLGEKLICLSNDQVRNMEGTKVPIYNGMIGQVVRVGERLDTTLELRIQFDSDLGPEYSQPLAVSALRAHFDVYQNPDALKYVRWWDRRDNQEFDFGYAITVHKAQGSQWDNVLFWDDGFLVWNRKDRARWMYTAITRAAENLTIVGG